MPKESLKTYAYNTIKQKIISCEYAPGTILSEELLCEQLGISRTPVRDAVSRLEQDGMISILPKKGIMVSTLSITEINFIFETRLLFEPYALLEYGSKIDNEVFLDFFNRFSVWRDFENTSYYFQIDDEFHSAVISAVDNHYLRYTYDCIHNQNLRFRVISGKDSLQRMQETNQEHLDIVRCCLKSDWEGASRAMRKHLAASRSATFDALLGK